ncbi:hypothetical protein ACFL5Z_17045 [Planctomycetota bacterium]
MLSKICYMILITEILTVVATAQAIPDRSSYDVPEIVYTEDMDTGDAPHDGSSYPSWINWVVILGILYLGSPLSRRYTKTIPIVGDIIDVFYLLHPIHWFSKGVSETKTEVRGETETKKQDREQMQEEQFIISRIDNMKESERVSFLVSSNPEERTTLLCDVLSCVDWGTVALCDIEDRDTRVARAALNALVSIGNIDLIEEVEDVLSGKLDSSELAIAKEALVQQRRRIAKAKNRMLCWENDHPSISDIRTSEMYNVVDSFEDVEHFSTEIPVLLFADRTDKGEGQWRALLSFEEEVLSNTWPALRTAGVKICWANVGGIVSCSALAKHLKEEGLRKNGCFLFSKGKLLIYKKVGVLHVSEDYVKAALDLL